MALCRRTRKCMGALRKFLGPGNPAFLERPPKRQVLLSKKIIAPFRAMPRHVEQRSPLKLHPGLELSNSTSLLQMLWFCYNAISAPLAMTRRVFRAARRVIPKSGFGWLRGAGHFCFVALIGHPIRNRIC